jgi:RNA polymerase sigma factor (sigma-70 family)
MRARGRVVSTPPELTRLLEAPAAPDLDARWADFVRVHSRLLLHTARSMATDGDSAMDAYAYVLEQLRKDECHRLRAFTDDGRARFTTWLVVVARRLCLDQRRSLYGRQRTEASTEERDTRRRLQDLVSASIDTDAIPDHGQGSPDGALLREEASLLLNGVLEDLPSRDRLLLTLRFQDGESAPRIARLLGYPTAFHVYRHLNALLERLRKQLRDKGIDGPAP